MSTNRDQGSPPTLTRSGAAPWPNNVLSPESNVLAEVNRLVASGRSAEAEQACRRFLDRSPDAPGVLNALALLLQRRGDLAGAEPLLRRALEATPRDAGLHNNLGGVLFDRGDTAGAEQSWRRAVALDPRHADAFYNLGVALRSLGRTDESLAAYRKAVAINPSHARAHAQIGALMGERGDSKSALAEFDAAIAADGKSYDAHYYRGTLLAGEERFEDAILSFQSAIAVRPDRHEARYALGNALASLGDRNEAALKSYGEAIRAAPGFLHAHYAYVTLAWTMGLEAAQKLETYAWARSQLGDTPDLLLAEGEFRIRFGDLAGAEALLRDAHASDGGRADILNTLARAVAYQLRIEECALLYEQAIRVEPNNPQHRQDLGVQLLRGRRSIEAASALEQALALAPLDQTTLGYLLVAYRETGDSRAHTMFDHTLVREYEIAVPAGFSSVADFNQALRSELETLHTARVEPLFQTLQNGTQTLGDLFSRPTRAIQTLHEKLREAVADYVAHLDSDEAHPFLSRRTTDFSFAGSWSCRLNPNGFHSNHVHSKGWISSAYYVSLPAAVTASEDHQGWLKFGESNLLLGNLDQTERLVQPKVGKLVLFPSYFWHGTVPFSSDETRLGVAFDVVPGKIARPVPEWAKSTA